MKILTYLSIFFTLSCRDNSNLKTTKSDIYGGTPTGELYPSTGAIYKNDRLVCSASLISSRFVITAAHCIKDDLQFRLKKFTQKIIKTFPHPNYKNSMVGQYDLAILELENPIEINNYSKISFQKANYLSYLEKENSFQIVGHGTREDGNFGESYYTSVPLKSWTTQELFLSAPGKDTCAGDSGGPVYYKNNLVAITSRAKGNQCGQGGFYTYLLDSLNWISKFLPQKVETQFKENDSLLESCQSPKNEYAYTLKSIQKSLGISCKELLENKSKIKKINLSHSHIKNIEPLLLFENLELLNLKDNHITDIELLSILPLKQINVSLNDLSEIPSWPSILVGSKIQKNTYRKTQFLEECQKQLQSHEVKEILSLLGTQSCDEANRKLLNSRVLNLSNKNISDIKILNNLPQLEELYLIKNNITDFSPLQTNPLLSHANLSFNPGQVEINIPFIHVKKTVETPFLDYCINKNNVSWEINSTVALVREKIKGPDSRKSCEYDNYLLVQMTSLDLSEGNIIDLSPLEGLPFLETLNLKDNQISDLSPISNLKSLKTINVTENYIEDFSVFEKNSQVEIIGRNQQNLFPF